MAGTSALLRQPLVHFLAIGAVVFVAYEALSDKTAGTARAQIVVTQEKVEQLATSFQSIWRRPPTESEMAALIDDFIREEVLVREAMALALDQNDAVIRRRLRQKMEFLTESAVGAQTPSDEHLREFFIANSQRYLSDATIGFDQVYLGQNPDADEIAQMEADLRGGADPVQAGQRTLLPPSMPASQQVSVDGAFGRGFFGQLTQITGDEWSGPVRSGYGFHFVRITERTDPELPSLETVRAAVISDWRKERGREIAETQIQQMLARYDIERADQSGGSAIQQ